MAKLTSIQMTRLEQTTLKTLHRIKIGRNLADWQAAKLGESLLEKLGNHLDALSFLKNRCKVPSSTADLILKQAKALKAIPGETMWEAVGWTGIRKLVGLSAAKRKTATQQILKAYGKDQKKFGAKKLGKIIGAAPAAKASGKSCSGCSQMRKELVLLKAALRELAEAIPLARRSLTPEVAKLLAVNKRVG